MCTSQLFVVYRVLMAYCKQLGVHCCLFSEHAYSSCIHVWLNLWSPHACIVSIMS